MSKYKLEKVNKAPMIRSPVFHLNLENFLVLVQLNCNCVSRPNMRCGNDLHPGDLELTPGMKLIKCPLALEWVVIVIIWYLDHVAAAQCTQTHIATRPYELWRFMRMGWELWEGCGHLVTVQSHCSHQPGRRQVWMTREGMMWSKHESWVSVSP